MTAKNVPKILIVDDTSENLLVIAKTLELDGYDMRFSEDGATAISMAKNTSFDLILLDVMMPKMDGFEVCKRLKADPDTNNVPVIFITAKTDTESIVKGFEIGGVDYITKPFHLGELRARVETHLSLRLREQELRQLNATKDKFISIVAHELKIPLGGIQGFVSLLHEQFEKFSIADIRENVSLIKDAVGSLSTLIENLLNWSNLHAGLVLYSPTKLKLYPLFINVLEAYEQDAADKKIKLDIQKTQGIEDISIYADIEMIETVLSNIVSNAIKFGKNNGTVLIKVEPRATDTLVIVEDDGSGIADKNHDKIFRLDAELKQTGSSGEIGTGMGLILAKEYVDRHGGNIWLESDYGKGTKVFFTLPSIDPDK